MFSGYRRRFFQDVSFAIIFMGLLSQAISDIPTILRGSKRYFMQAIDGNVFDRMFLLEGDNKSHYGTVEEFVDGSKYYVPDNTNGSQPISNIEEQEASIVEYASKIVNEELKTNECLQFMGTWIYTICYDGRVRNVTQNFRWANFPNILLGESVHDSEAEEPLKLLKDEDGYYLSEVLGSGAICSLTGEFRTTEIIYRCDGDVRTDRLKSAVEVGTCKYKLTATLGKLCELPLLSQNAFPDESNTIYFEKGHSGLLDVSSWLDHYEVDRVAGHFYLLSTYFNQLNNDAPFFVLLYTRFSMVEPNNAPISQNTLYKDALMAAMDILASGLSRFSIFPNLVLIEKHELYLRVIDYQHNTLAILRLYQGSDNSLDMTTVDPEVVGNMEKGNFYNYCDEYLKQKKVSDYK